MKLGIMQPYLFPYIGYFQLINTVDTFVIYDDVQYIKGGWINRNRILLNGEPKYITLPVHKDALRLDINQRQFRTTSFQEDKAALLRQMEAAYGEAPYFAETMHLAGKCFECGETNVATFVSNTIRLICAHLGICTPLCISASLNKETTARAQERVLSICKILGADEYINPIGGIDLYNKEEFARNGMKLAFIRPQPIEYTQFDKPFVPWLSIIDVLMFNSRECTQQMLTKFDLE